MPRISIVITTYNKWEMTWHTVDSLYRTCPRKEIELILVDNGSTDRTLELSPYFDTVVQNEVPRNLARSLNLGAAAATGDLVGFFNNDLCVLVPDWLGPLLDAAARLQDAAIMPLLVEGVAPSPELYALLQSIGRANQAGACHAVPIHTHLEMACTFFPRALLERLGPFDETLPVWYHHQDYFVRMRAAGTPIYRLLNCVVRHLGNVTINYSHDDQTDELLRQEYHVFCERYPAEYLRPLGLVMPPFGPYDLVPGGETVVYTDRLRAADVLASFGVRHD